MGYKEWRFFPNQFVETKSFNQWVINLLTNTWHTHEPAKQYFHFPNGGKVERELLAENISLCGKLEHTFLFLTPNNYHLPDYYSV